MVSRLESLDSKDTKERNSDRSRQKLSVEYLVAKIVVFDPAENEPCKVCQKVVRQLDRFS